LPSVLAQVLQIFEDNCKKGFNTLIYIRQKDFLLFLKRRKKMKKLLTILCIAIMFLGVVGCPSSDDPASTLGQKSYPSTPVTPTDTDSDTGASPVPEPGTLILLGSGLVGLAGFGRKKFKK
jgi:hypothetical protein